MRIQEYRPRHNCVSIDRLAESPIENWKDTKNKLHQKLCHYFDIIERVVIKRENGVAKREKSNKHLVQSLRSYLIPKTKSTF